MKRKKTQPVAKVEALPIVEPPRRRPVIVALAVGFVIWALLWGFQDITAAPALQFNLGPARWAIVALFACLAAWPPVAQLLTAVAKLFSSQLQRRPGLSALAVMVVSSLYLMLTAHLQARDLFPKTHDDQSYLIQMQMLARFRLWMPQHPIADFFDTFYVISRPVYASLYFPGAALLYVPTIWLGLPTWFLPALVAGGCVALLYTIISEMVNPVAGLLAAAALVSLEYFRVYSVLLTGHEPMLLMGLLLTWSWLRWNRSERPSRWAFLIGLFAGWGAITRPADAVCYAIPIGISMLWTLLRLKQDVPTSAARYKRLALTAALVVAGAMPFLLLQAIFNKGVTGSWLDTPYTYYLRLDQPNTTFGFHDFDPAARPASSLQQKQDYYDQFFAPYILRHQPNDALRWWGKVYLPMTFDTALPTRLAIPLACVGLLTLLADKRRWVIAAALPIFVAVFYFNVFFLEHYALQVIPALLLLVLLGIHRLAATWPTWSLSIRAAVSAGFLCVCILILPEFNPLWAKSNRVSDETLDSPFVKAAKQELPNASDLKTPAVILFSYRFGDSLVEDPVYNSDVAWPDDATVIYARDLGDRNREIFQYYADRMPERHFYRYDRHSAELIQYLGTAANLAKK